MDQVKIGKFIAERRKKANLTQMQLAEKLNITDRAISKWETGNLCPTRLLCLNFVMFWVSVLMIYYVGR